MRALCIALFVSLLAVTHGARNLSAIYRFSARLSGDDYVVHWSFDTATKNITFAVRVRTTGWIGFGLSPNGQMPNSDVIVGWVDTNGQATLHDRFARGRFTPPIDSEQNWFLIRGEEEGDFTILEFWRNFTSCDSDNDINLNADTARVIWSYHADDPSDPTGSIPRHQFQGTRSINFFAGAPTPRSTPSDSNSFKIRNTNYSVPKNETTYYCSLHYLHDIITDIDTSKEKIYFYKVAPLIPPENLPYVHHQLIFLCPLNTQLANDGPCGNVFFGCFGGQIIAAWAVGGESFEMPEGIGFPLGGLNQPFLILLEVHYDNPNSVEGIVDSSGMELFYTKMAPVHEAGGMSISFPVAPLMVIPPKVERYDYTVYCLGSCTERYIPDDGVTVFASFLHTHLIGTGLIVRHYRQTTSDSQCSAMEELEPIDQNLLYDFDYQQFNNLQRTVQVRKGDTLAVQCFYNSMNRDKVTLGGESTREEMCQTLLYYYPRVPLVTCATFPDPNITHRNFFIKYFSNHTESVNMAVDALNGDHYPGVAEAFNNITWNTTSVNDLKQVIESAPVQLAICAEDGGTYVVNNTVEPKVQVDCPYVAPNECNCFTPPSCCQRVAGASVNNNTVCPRDNSTSTTMASDSSTGPTTPAAASHLSSAGALFSLMALLLTVLL